MPVTSASNAIKAGTVAYFAASSAPSLWLKANGAEVSRATFAALFSVVGTTYGAGDGSTTFNVPDLRGEFMRGVDDGRGVDTGRAIGTAQAGSRVGYVNDSRITCAQTAAAANGDADVTMTGALQNTYAAVNGLTIGAYQVRPRNVALLACIKY